MTRSLSRTWYRVAIARPNAAPMLLAAEGEHLGVAIAAAEQHVRGAHAIAADVAASSEIPLGESVGKERVVELGTPAHELSMFRWPAGAIPALGSPGLIGVQRGYAMHDEASGLFVVEAQTDAEHVTDLYLGMLEHLPAADNLEIRLLDHFEDAGQTDVWLTSRVDAKRIIRFLDDHDELLGNGHLELNIYVRKHKASLRLTEHKTVVWLAEDRGLASDVEGWLRELGVPRVDGLVTLTRTPHFHYRPVKSRDRKKLSEHLYRQRLRRVDTLRTDAAPAPADAPPAR